MKNRNVFLSLLMIVVLLVIAFMKMHWWEPGSKLSLNRNPSHIEYTKHALCRMDCRHITAGDITGILKYGEINYTKSNENDKPCPTFAVQGYTGNKQHLRIIVAQCGRVAKVITCYNLDVDFKCDCPGDSKKGISFFNADY